MFGMINREQLYSKCNSQIESAFGTPASEHLALVEVGPSASYDHIHLKGAVHLELLEIVNRSQHWFPNQAEEIVVYGENSTSTGPREALRLLHQKGFYNLYYYAGGKEDWMGAGLAMEYSLVPADHF